MINNEFNEVKNILRLRPSDPTICNKMIYKYGSKTRIKQNITSNYRNYNWERYNVDVNSKF